MKKVIFLLLVLLTAAMYSCSDNTDRHELSIVYPNGFALFADQTQDSIVFLTFDSWQVSSNASWISVVGKSREDITYDYYKNYLIHVDLALEPNTTGRTRMGNVMVRTYDYEGAGLYVQYPFLNITHPTINLDTYIGNNNSVPSNMDFVLRDSANAVNDSLCFNVRKEWTLSFASGADQTWLQLPTTSGAEGYNVVPITLEQNLTPQERKTELILTSSGVENHISIVQTGAKK